MTRRAYTLVELFLAIFLGSVLVAIALPFFRPTTDLTPRPVAAGLSSLERAKRELALRRSLPSGTVITLEVLKQSGLLATIPPAPEGCVYVPGKVGGPASIALAQ